GGGGGGGERGGGGGGSGVGRAGGGVLCGRLAGDRAAWAARAGDGGGDPAGSRGKHAGGRDAGVRRVLHGDGARRRDADVAAAGRTGAPPGAGAVAVREETPGGVGLPQVHGARGPPFRAAAGRA